MLRKLASESLPSQDQMQLELGPSDARSADSGAHPGGQSYSCCRQSDRCELKENSRLAAEAT